MVRGYGNGVPSNHRPRMNHPCRDSPRLTPCRDQGFTSPWITDVGEPDSARGASMTGAARTTTATRHRAHADEGAYASLVSASADAVTLCLIADDGSEERLPLTQRDFGVWHGFVPGLAAGQRYGYPSRRPVRPVTGTALRPRQAPRSIPTPGRSPARCGTARRSTATRRATRLAQRTRLGRQRPGGPDRRRVLRLGRRRTPSDTDRGHRSCTRSTSRASRSGIRTSRPTCAGPTPGLAHPAAIAAPASTSASPRSSCCRCTSPCTEPFWSHAHGLINYWGYNTLGFFAPHAAYSAEVRAGRPGGQVAEFKAMVKALHAAGLEVILDVVFNHTGRGRRGRAHPLVPRARQRPLLPPRSDEPARLRGHDRLRQLPGRRLRRRPAPHHGLAALLGRADARRRLPLRPGPDPGPGGRACSSGRRPSSTSSRRIRSCRWSS